ncbi:YgaP family membrane protein [Flagellimonas sp.]|uniref:YgaP family membrane protein n=1 Tax=Flagellimonas sp. TaxID=2058762 RepID=UPI003BAA58BE
MQAEPIFGNLYGTNLKLSIMKKNMGGADRTIRILLALGVGTLYYFNVITGTLAYVLLALAAIFVLTSFISFCPLYTLFGINTCKVKN